MQKKLRALRLEKDLDDAVERLVSSRQADNRTEAMNLALRFALAVRPAAFAKFVARVKPKVKR